MLYCLMDGHARTGTELAVVGGVSASTASVHLKRLTAEHLVKVMVQGRHRFYSLSSPDIAKVLEALNVVAGAHRKPFDPSTPSELRLARTCYDHLAGILGVGLHDRWKALGWLTTGRRQGAYDLTAEGSKGFAALGIDVAATQRLRRHFAYACLDWSERKPHVGGALAAAVLEVALRRKWVIRQLDSRALEVASLGRREMLSRFGLEL